MTRSTSFDLNNLLIGLAWMGEASTSHIARLWMPNHGLRSTQLALKALLVDEYVARRYWYLPSQPKVDGSVTGPVRQDALWSLAKPGRDLVRDLDTYPPASIAPRHRKLLLIDSTRHDG